jgi:NAD(P)-dependent dehydrogenase (short-subunit alcohol dehydrogenase family)
MYYMCAQSTAKSFKETLDVNLIAVDYLTRRLLPILGDHRSSERKDVETSKDFSLLKTRLLSRICVVSSAAAHRPVPNWSSYCVAKAGLLMWSRCAAAGTCWQSI